MSWCSSCGGSIYAGRCQNRACPLGPVLCGEQYEYRGGGFGDATRTATCTKPKGHAGQHSGTELT